MEINILRTLQRLSAATKEFSGKQNFVKFSGTLQIDIYKSAHKSWKVLVKEHIFGKVADSQPAIFPK